MSDTGVVMPLAEARAFAEEIVLDLRPFCDRIEIAGSIRRGEPHVGDVDLVVIPRSEHRQFDLFGAPVGAPTDLLHEHVAALLAAGKVEKRRDRSGRTFWGQRDKRLLWCDGAAVGIPVDVFGALPPPGGARWRSAPGRWR